MFIDSHCHLDYDVFTEEGLDVVVDRARALNVQQMLTISVRISKFDRVLNTALASPYLDCTVGTHPCEAHVPEELPYTKDDIVKMAQHERVVGIGETGLDYYHDASTIAIQKENFIKHIEAAIETDLPIIIHSRDADEDMIDMLREYGRGKLRGVMHCFSSGPELCKAAVDLGFYISIAGIVTFKNAESLRDIVRQHVPMDRLLIETDAPYLAPVPKRGKGNEPSFVTHTAKYIADMKDMPVEELGRITTENYFRLFSKSKNRAVVS